MKIIEQSSQFENLQALAQNIGFSVMVFAATMGLVELPHNLGTSVPHTLQSAYAFAAGEDKSTLRREKEEAGPHYISYGVSQRTPGRTGLV